MGMNRTADEIKKGLECCNRTFDACHKCPYDTVDEGWGCTVAKNADALALIQQLESDKQQLEGMLTHMNQLRDAAAGRALKMEERVHQLEAERDAAVDDMTEMAQYVSDDVCTWCDQCECERGCMGTGANSGFNWRGVQKEE